MKDSDLKTSLGAEADRIEEDALNSMKGHFNDGSFWAKIHMLLGVPSVILAAWAGIEALSNTPKITALLALAAAALTAVNTFLKPQSTAQQHKSSGREYNKLKNRARYFRESQLLFLDEKDATKTLEELIEVRDQLNTISPDISRRSYEKATKDINEGRAVYRTDKGKNNG